MKFLLLIAFCCFISAYAQTPDSGPAASFSESGASGQSLEKDGSREIMEKSSEEKSINIPRDEFIPGGGENLSGSCTDSEGKIILKGDKRYEFCWKENEKLKRGKIKRVKK